ncbi:type IV pilus twitching motility protein PilT [Paenisporosarcina sp. TG20]|uniref:type IV pilus twitching motility protein PilT n=1 Tax=Paenisporosarcina sp. TG20 TaxID=1211706 RepID=UPI0002E99E83|nr:type IV pilus twitching motility protein PilT [Paenisporosarcina sp. TG20]
MRATVDKLLTSAFQQSASDIHITVGVPPIFRVQGDLVKFGTTVVTADMSREMARVITPEKFWETLLELGEIDFSHVVEGVARFRVNAFQQKGKISIAFRTVPQVIPTVEQLQMPNTLKKLAELKQGLILVTGPTGSGKSTTLAAMIKHMNTDLNLHIITLEDPIEYMHEHGSSIIDQREVGFDTKSFSSALRAALRQDPDVILVGEMRDLETIGIAITAAETGHLVLGTLHTSSASSTIERIIDVFSPEQQGQVRTQLGGVLKAVISQRLLKTVDGKGRRAATEILISNPAIGNLIRTQKVHQIPNVILTNRALGMHMMATSIQELVESGQVSKEVAKPYLEGDEH